MKQHFDIRNLILLEFAADNKSNWVWAEPNSRTAQSNRNKFWRDISKNDGYASKS